MEAQGSIQLGRQCRTDEAYDPRMQKYMKRERETEGRRRERERVTVEVARERCGEGDVLWAPPRHRTPDLKSFPVLHSGKHQKKPARTASARGIGISSEVQTLNSTRRSVPEEATVTGSAR